MGDLLGKPIWEKVMGELVKEVRLGAECPASAEHKWPIALAQCCGPGSSLLAGTGPGSYCKAHRRQGKMAKDPWVILPLLWALEDWRDWWENLEEESPPLRNEIRVCLSQTQSTVAEAMNPILVLDGRGRKP